jgi:CPA1 family monovalent cation:H+ antiporter
VDQLEILIVSLLVAVAGLSALAHRIGVPYPIVLVIGGALFGFVPGVPKIHLNPNVVLLVFLPPLLYGAAVFANLRDLRANLRVITLNSVGLVLLTMVAVALVAHELIDGMGWGPAFALGAIVSPTDPLAGGLIMRRLGVPRRMVSAIEGEGLFNDATALVAFKVAVAAVVSGMFSLGHATLSFFAGAAGGVAIGLVAGWLFAKLREHTVDADVSTTLSLLTSYAAFVPANALGASGVLAVVTAGIFFGIRAPRIIAPRTRLQSGQFWGLLDFLVNATLFVLIGLQLRFVVERLHVSAVTLAGYALAVSAVVVLARFVWIFTVTVVIRALDRRPSQVARRASWQLRLIGSWAGTRGAVSLAAALALPFETDAGGPFPERNLIIFLTFAVIFFTLVVQGLSLPLLIRRLGVADDDEDGNEELRARLTAAKAALERIDTLKAEEWTRDDTLERLQRLYEYRKRRFAARAGKIEDDGYEDRSLAYQQTLQSVLGAQRDALVNLRDDGTISNDVMNRVMRELDLEESRLEI